MRALAPLLAVVLLAGCIQIQIAPNGEPTEGPSSSGGSGTGATGKPAPLKVDFTWSPTTPRTQQDVRFEGKVEGLNGKAVDAWGWTFGDNGTARTAAPVHKYAKAGEWTVTVRILTTDGKTAQATHRIFVLNQGGGSGAPQPPQGNKTPEPEAPPPTPGVFDCGGAEVIEPFDTFGRDDSLPALSWAALKSGFRFAVAWQTEQATTETLRYTIGRGAERTATDLAPTKVHLFVLEGMAAGETICFTAGAAPLHAARAANAMTAFQPGEPHGMYVVNYLVLVNEGGDVGEVEAGMARFADLLWDSTDGWVRAGALLVFAGDYLHHNSGWSTCYIPSVDTPLCHRSFDVVVTEDAVPQGAASTYRQGVTDPDVAMWMNMHWQAVPGPLSMDDFGAVLVHESGHYLFDMDDLYGDPVVPDSQECDIAEFDISIMGGGRELTEFDDAAHPCPTQGSGYVPSWTLMRGQFPEIPERESIDPGPFGNGGLAFVQTYRGP